jgi:hypothetical protein
MYGKETCIKLDPTLTQAITLTETDPETITVGKPTRLDVRALISDPSVVPESVRLEQLSLRQYVRHLQQLSGTWGGNRLSQRIDPLRDDGKNFDEVAGDGSYWGRTKIYERVSGVVRLRVTALFRTTPPADCPYRFGTSDVTLIPVGAVISAEGGTVTGRDGTRVTVPPGAVDYPVVVGIAPADVAEFDAPPGPMPLIDGFTIVFEPLEGDLFPPASLPLEISLPAPAGVAGTDFIIAEERIVDVIDADPPGLYPRFVPMDTAVLDDGRIVTNTYFFDGIRSGGTFAVLGVVGSGNVLGVVRDATGPRHGVVVSNDSNTLVALSNTAGQYATHVSANSFNMSAFDPFRLSINAGTPGELPGSGGI